MKVLTYAICAAASCGMAFASPIGEAIGRHLDDGDLPGAVSVVVDAQGQMTVDCRGYADLGTKTPMRSDTIFWLASNTKAIAAATLMTLVDEGKVKLDDPVSKYLPEFANVTVKAKDGARQPVRPMTVRMTLSHMSGLPFFPGMPIDKRPISELAHLATVTPLAADPGERYAYSNWGIDVAMAVVENVTGRSFASVMKERIIIPLGMKDAVFIPSNEQMARLAKSYHLDDAKPPKEIKIGQFRYPYTDPTREPEGGGGLFGTADDLCRFFRMLASGGTAPDGRRILSEQAVREMTRRQTPDRPKIASYGFGLNVKPDSVGHGGAYGTYAAFNPKTKAVRVLCISMQGKNSRRSAFWSAWGKAVDAYFKDNRPQKTERPFIAASEPYVGAGATDYPVKAADMTNVAIKAGFWLPRFETNRVVTVKVDFEKSEETGRLANFREAAKRAQGTFKGCPFDDSDVFKIIEGAAYTLATHPDPKLEKYLDDLIADIAGAQEEDGYLYTARTLGMEKVKGFSHAKMMGPERWSNTSASHEFYNMGHMIEAGVAYWRVTGKRALLDVAIKAADMMDRTFGHGSGQIQRVPGHEEIELALCKLYRATGEVRYLKLAKTLLDFRGVGKAYNQNHLPVTRQDQACGHAVRAGYLYTAMADVAALLGDPSYRVASERLWKDVVDTKLHLNGGIGAHRRAVVPGFGSVGEAFGAPYDLPNENAYLETCAAIANALWNDRLFLFSGDGKYMDIIERIIYNGFLSGISMSGDEFFYPNPLASAGGYKRSKWFGCSCCPVNVVRFIPQIAQYAYSTSGDTAYLNLYIASDARLSLASGAVTLAQRTDYPWKGTSTVNVTPTSDDQRFTLKVRIPGWATGHPVPSTLYEQTVRSDASGISVKVNGTAVPLVLDKGYCTIDRAWRRGDTVEVDIPMPVKRIKADDRVVADRGRMAVERGPIVWCAEGIDNGGRARDIVLPADAAFAESSVDVCGVRMPALEATGHHADNGNTTTKSGADVKVKLIPYFAWCHREAGEMQTWFPTADETVACRSLP